jgi:cobyrinic acid a,c-diamide synthase
MDAADTPPRCRIGIARDEAFHFYYEYNLARLGASGAELVEFSPVHDDKLPDVNGLYLGGGYPESMGRELAANATMRAQVQRFGASGGPIYAECGGLMYLARAIRVLDGTTYPMAGLFEADAVMRERLQAIGYAEVEATGSSFLGPSGMRWRGHQFRYSSLEPDLPHDVQCVFRVTPRWGGSEFIEGYSLGNVIASYVHAHWASNPKIAQHFVAAYEKYRNTL